MEGLRKEGGMDPIKFYTAVTHFGYTGITATSLTNMVLCYRDVGDASYNVSVSTNTQPEGTVEIM